MDILLESTAGGGCPRQSSPIPGIVAVVKHTGVALTWTNGAEHLSIHVGDVVCFNMRADN